MAEPPFLKGWQLESPSENVGYSILLSGCSRRITVLLFKRIFVSSPLHSAIILHENSHSSPSLSQMGYNYIVRKCPGMTL